MTAPGKGQQHIERQPADAGDANGKVLRLESYASAEVGLTAPRGQRYRGR